MMTHGFLSSTHVYLDTPLPLDSTKERCTSCIETKVVDDFLSVSMLVVKEQGRVISR